MSFSFISRAVAGQLGRFPRETIPEFAPESLNWTVTCHILVHFSISGNISPQALYQLVLCRAHTRHRPVSCPHPSPMVLGLRGQGVGHLRSPLPKNDGDKVQEVVRVVGDDLCAGLRLQGSGVRGANLLKYEVYWISIESRDHARLSMKVSLTPDSEVVRDQICTTSGHKVN